MASWIWILIVIVVVAVIVLVAALGTRRRRTSVLRRRFGPEYDRTVEAREDRRSAEAELRAREKQRAQFTVKPLPEATRLRFAQQWRGVQERFVDQPSQSLAGADALVTRLMEARGYPTTQFESQADVVSVDHPDVVENYRFGHAVWRRSQTQQISTEELREALLRYRSLFDELLRPDAAGEPDATGQPDASGEAAAGSGQAGAGEPTPGPTRGETGAAAGGSTNAGTAAPTADVSAPETGDPAYQDQPTRGGTP